MSFVPCICWVKRGVSALRPTAVKLDREQMKELLKGRGDAEETSESEMDGALPSSPLESRGLRGSAPSSHPMPEAEGETIDERYDLESYDKVDTSVLAGDDTVETSGALNDIACFASPEEDPDITNQEDSDDDDAILKPTDNLLLVGRAEKDQFNLEVHVYNEYDEAFYCHHDYLLGAPPLCIDSINYDPGTNGKGNLCAIGGMLPIVEIWDMDMMETLEPVVSLGKVKAKKKRKKQKPGKSKPDSDKSNNTPAESEASASSKHHTEAVLDVAWNANIDHLLASGSADQSIIIWDLDKAIGALQVLPAHDEKVQSIKWHPVEAQILASGGCDNYVKIWDGRDAVDGAKISLSLDDEVERVLWNHFDPFYLLASTSAGSVYCIDSRKPIASPNQAHNDAVTGLSLSPSTSGLLVTGSVDHMVKIWQLSNGSSLSLIAEENFSIGRIHCASFCPDNCWLVALGAEKEEPVKLWDVRNSDNVAERFQVSSQIESNEMVQ